MEGIVKKNKNEFYYYRVEVGICIVVCILLGLYVSLLYLQLRVKVESIPAIAQKQGESKVKESIVKGGKEKIALVNKGKVPVYGRSRIFVYYVGQNGEILCDSPIEGKDYIIVWGESEKFMKNEDGFIYYLKPIKERCKSEVLIEEVRNLTKDKKKRLEFIVVTQLVEEKKGISIKEAFGV